MGGINLKKIKKYDIKGAKNRMKHFKKRNLHLKNDSLYAYNPSKIFTAMDTIDKKLTYANKIDVYKSIHALYSHDYNEDDIKGFLIQYIIDNDTYDAVNDLAKNLQSGQRGMK